MNKTLPWFWTLFKVYLLWDIKLFRIHHKYLLRLCPLVSFNVHMFHKTCLIYRLTWQKTTRVSPKINQYVNWKQKLKYNNFKSIIITHMIFSYYKQFINLKGNFKNRKRKNVILICVIISVSFHHWYKSVINTHIRIVWHFPIEFYLCIVFCCGGFLYSIA